MLNPNGEVVGEARQRRDAVALAPRTVRPGLCLFDIRHARNGRYRGDSSFSPDRTSMIPSPS